LRERFPNTIHKESDDLPGGGGNRGWRGIAGARGDVLRPEQQGPEEENQPSSSVHAKPPAGAGYAFTLTSRLAIAGIISTNKMTPVLSRQAGKLQAQRLLTVRRAGHHINGAKFGGIKYTEPFLNNHHIAERTLHYVENLLR
jgi:hypothetical protein